VLFRLFRTSAFEFEAEQQLLKPAKPLVKKRKNQFLRRLSLSPFAADKSFFLSPAFPHLTLVILLDFTGKGRAVPLIRLLENTGLTGQSASAINSKGEGFSFVSSFHP
jgi:hypothetical protein